MNNSEYKEVILNKYPEPGLSGRGLLSYNWLPEKNDRILDAGCSYGYVTRFLKNKSKETYGIDLVPEQVYVAENRYEDIKFKCSSVDDTGYEDNFFDSIVFNDVLEHTDDKIKVLDELYRILKPGGTIIISTPHRGMFGIFDPYNYGYYLRKYLPGVYKFLYSFVRLLKEGKKPVDLNPAHLEKHYHYSYKDLKEMLDKSAFSDNYCVNKVFRSGLFMEVIYMNLEVFLSVIFKPSLLEKLLKPFKWLADIDYKISYGPLAYNIAIRVIKNERSG